MSWSGYLPGSLLRGRAGLDPRRVWGPRRPVAGAPSFHACREAAATACGCGMSPAAHHCWLKRGGCGAQSGEPCVVSPPAHEVDRRDEALRAWWAQMFPVDSIPWIEDALDRTNYLLNEHERLLAQAARLQQTIDQLTRERGGR